MKTVGFLTILLYLWSSPMELRAQCQWYTVEVTDQDGTGNEVTWELIDDMGVIWLSGGSPYLSDVCLPDGCYTLLMYDSAGNGWENEDWIIEDWIGEFDWDTNLSEGFHGFEVLDLGDNGCDPDGGGTGCPAGTSEYNLVITGGTIPSEISWDLTLGSAIVWSGGAPFDDVICLGDGCFFLNLYDSGANGWQGAVYTLYDDAANVVTTGTLSTGAEDNILINIGGLDCSDADPGEDPTGSGCGSEAPSSDCVTAPCVCDPYPFNITPSGFGSINEIPSAGSISNPSYGPLNNAPWGGNDYGCLLAGELNSSWMMFTVGTGGTLEFSFGAGGEQSGYYDWAMWPYSAAACAGISGNTLPPARCVWNAVSWGGTGLASTIPAGGNAGNYGPPLTVMAGDQFIICFSNWSYVSDLVTLDFFGTAIIDCNIFLDLEEVNLSASRVPQGSYLEWSSTGMVETAYYEIFRSEKVSNWELVDVLFSNESEVEPADTYTDLNPNPGTNYYMIRKVDEYGKITESNVAAVSYYLDSSSPYPNPNNGSFWVPILEGDPVRVMAYSANGSNVPLSWRKVDGLLQVETALSPGIYLLVIEGRFGHIQTSRVIVEEQ